MSRLLSHLIYNLEEDKIRKSDVGNFSMIVLLCVMFNLDRAVIKTQDPSNKHHLSVALMGRHVLLLSCK